MGESDSNSTQSAKNPSSVNNSTSPTDLLKKAESLYNRFVNNQIEHVMAPGESNLSAAIEFFRNPVNQLETVVLLQESARLGAPLLKALLDPFNVPAARQNVDKDENGK